MRRRGVENAVASPAELGEVLVTDAAGHAESGRIGPFRARPAQGFHLVGCQPARRAIALHQGSIGLGHGCDCDATTWTQLAGGPPPCPDDQMISKCSTDQGVQMKGIRTASLPMAAASSFLSMIVLVGQAATDDAYPSEGSSITLVGQGASDLDRSPPPGNRVLQAAAGMPGDRTLRVSRCADRPSL